MNGLIALAEIVKDAQDNASVDAYLKEPESGMALDLVKRMVNGESPLAIHREWRGFSAAELARQSGVNRVQLLDIEARRKSGSIATMKKLAEALDVSIDDIVYS
ncbi:helix-turn-helix transcriptional regulator [Roseovarius sp. D0-M9]|uniref:helix-turn-helix transcriptional regulator n=1 Tax=Roseovarius sp. D0-M9 TaxID=3127117 RepID=UPI00300FEB4B